MPKKNLISCLMVTWILLLLNGRARADDRAPPRLGHATAGANMTSSPSEDSLDESVDASILKLSHHPAPRLLGGAEQNTKQNQQVPGKSEHRKESQTARLAATLKGHRMNSNEADHATPTTPAHQQRPHESGKTKRKGLMALMPQPRKLSISSLLPLRTSGNKQAPAVAAAHASSQLSTGSNKSQQQATGDPSAQLAGAMSEDEFNSMLAEQSAFTDMGQPFAGGLPVPPPPVPGTQHHHHQHPQQLMPLARHARHPPTLAHNQMTPPSHTVHDYQHQLGPPFDPRTQLAPSFEGQLISASPLFGPRTHHMVFGAAGPRASPQEMFVADQSGEHYRRIKLGQVAGARGNSLPFLLASTGEDSQQQQQQLNRTALLQAAAQQLTAAAAVASVAQAQQQQRQAASAPSVQTASGGNGSASLAPVAAVALLSERAKSLINQLNLAAAAAASNATRGNVRNNRETSSVNTASEQQAANGTASAESLNNNNNQLGLASMIKNAAEAWAATNSMTAPNGLGTGSLSADASPTIIVEHDGPTVTTLDYSGQRANRAPAPDDEDDVSANFYTETEEVEQEEGGSHQARRAIRPRTNPQYLQRQHQQHEPSPLYSGHNYHQGSYATGASSGRGPQVPSASEFFDEPTTGDQATQEMPPLRHSAYTGQQMGANGYQQSRRASPGGHGRDRYPDSINAIKEQGPRPSAHGKQTTSASSSTDDAIEHLIRELQELHRRRKSGGQRADEGPEQERGPQVSGQLKGASSDEFEDILGAGGQDQDGPDGGPLASNDDEQLRALRAKLLARLRAKHEKKKGAPSSSSFNGDSIRIPLHALLLAALDRRMSPSEPKSQSVSAGASQSEGPASILDERNRELLVSGREDFSEATANLDSLLEGTNLFEQVLKSAAGNSQQQPHQESGQMSTVDYSLKLPLNLQNISQESLTPAGMLLVENLASLDEANQKRMNLSQVASGQLDPTNFFATSTPTTSTPALTTTPTSTTTTPTSTTTAQPLASSTTSNPAHHQEPQADLQRHRGRLAPVDQRRSFKNHRDFSPSTGSGTGGSGVGQKGRRALKDEGDFDVDRHVDEYASDRNDRSLEPSWIKSGARGRRTGGGAGGKQRDGTVEFDDEFDEADRQTRRRIARQRGRRRNDQKGQHGNNNNNNNNNNDDEANYEANEQRFFNKMQQDTDANIGDVDKTIKRIEQSIPGHEQPRSRGRQRARSDEDEDEGETSSSASGNVSSDDDERGEPHDDSGEDDRASETRGRSRSHRSRSPDAAESQQSTATLRASMIDDEIRRMEEEEAKGKRVHGRHKSQRHGPGFESADSDSDETPDNGDADGGEPAESQINETRRPLDSTETPASETSHLKIVVESRRTAPDTGSAEVQLPEIV